MLRNAVETIAGLFASPHPDALLEGLILARRDLPSAPPEEARRVLALVASLFHLDTTDRPDLAPVIEEAHAVIASYGPRVVPLLLEALAPGDLKERLSLGEAFSRMGARAVEPLVEAYRATTDPVRRAVVVHALGKVASPAVVAATPIVLEAAASSDLDLRDDATRALGRMFEHVAAGSLAAPLRRAVVERLRQNAADEDAGVRALAVWALGRLGRLGHLDEAQRTAARELCTRLLGRQEFDWDRAYVVRREAEAALADLA